MKRILLAVAMLATFLFGIGAESTQAIPAFARRYKLTCKTCHHPFPRLTAYGEDFAGNGFQLPDGPEPAGTYLKTGDDELDLLRDFPLAGRFDLHGRMLPDQEESDSEFAFPDRVKLLSGGAIARDISYYFYFYMSEGGELTGVEDAYIHFNNLGGSEFDIIAGQFQLCDPLFKRELRLTYEDYLIYKQRIGSSRVNLAYDRGFMFTWTPMDGTDLTAMVVNGNGIGETGVENSMDNDGFKNVFGRLSQDIGETGLRLGGMYYFARDTQNAVTDEIWYWGVDGTFDFKDTFQLNVQYMERRDDDPFYTGVDLDDEFETKGGLIEAIFAPADKESNHFFVLLYNWIDADLDIYDAETVALNATYLLRRNVKMFVEYGRDIEHEANAFTGGLLFAF